MLDQPTVLVLGAGASQPYGFPTSGQLRKWILGKAFYPNDPEDAIIEECNLLLRTALHTGNVGQNELDDFRRDFFASQRVSVDAFIQDRSEFQAIGKTAITCALLVAEKHSRLDGDWYQVLLEHIRLKPVDRWSKTLAVITFNYDRSFEHYFLRSFTSSFGADTARQLRKMINVCHVYGYLGPHALKDKHAPELVAFGDTSMGLRATGNIDGGRTGEKPAELDGIHSILEGAKKIFIYGFAFWPENLRLLKIPNPEQKSIVASGYLLPPSRRLSVESKLEATGHIVWGGPNQKIIELVHEPGF